MENRTRSAKLMNITAMAAFGTLGYFVAKIPLASEEIAFFRAVIAAVVILAWQLVRGRKFRLPASRKSLILLMASGAMIGFNWIFLFEAYHYTSVSVATLSYYFAPVIVMAACPLLAETDNLFCVFNGRPRSCDILRRPGGRQQQCHGSWLRTGGRGFIRLHYFD